MVVLPRIVIITPALASANNGNWQTAMRWQRFLAGHARVSCALEWDGEPADLMIALHARRSAASIAAFHPSGRPLVLVLTGTDLYRDIHQDESARNALALADAIVCLQAHGPSELARPLRSRTHVIFQSAPPLAPLPRRKRTVDLALVGHLRAEKDPMTAMRALAMLAWPRLRLLQIGADREPGIGRAVRKAAAADPRIVMLGALPHARTRAWIRRSCALLLPSVLEGGANVLVEAAMSDVPVLASRIGGSVGMLGEGYDGYFPVGDAHALATLIERTVAEPLFHQHLREQVRHRAQFFEPSLERARVQRLVARLLARQPRHRQ